MKGRWGTLLNFSFSKFLTFTMAFSILPATPQDSIELDRLVNSAYRGDSSRQGWTTEADLLDGGRTDAAAIEEIICKPGHTILKYVEGDRIIGCVELRKEKGRLYLGMLSVLPQLQSKGIGKQLLKAAEADAQRQRCRSIYMTVISIRTELMDWYVRHGFRDTGRRKPFLFNDPRFGQPRLKLEFAELEKIIQVTGN